MSDNIRLAQEFKRGFPHTGGGYVLIEGGAAFCWVSELENYTHTHDDIGSLIAVGDDGVEYDLVKIAHGVGYVWRRFRWPVEVPRHSKSDSQSEMLTFYKVLNRITVHAKSKGFSCTVRVGEIIEGVVFEFSNGNDRLTTMITRDFIERAENVYDFIISEIDRRPDSSQG